MPAVRPTLPAPADTVPTDTVTTASAAVADTVEAYHEPQYLDGFPTPRADGATVLNDVALPDIGTLPVVEQPAAGAALPFVPSPLHDTVSMGLLLAGLLAVLVTYRTGYKYYENLLHYLFSIRRRENLFEDHTVDETQVIGALTLNTCIVEGFVMYCAVQWWVPRLVPGMQRHVWWCICGLTALALVFYLLQWGGYRLLGYVFSDKVGTKLLLDGFKSSQTVLGLALLPVLLLLLLYPSQGWWLLPLAGVCYAAVRVLFICKGFRIFYSNLSSILYFILYLCAVEIVPLVVMAGVTVWLCGILQS